MLGNKDKQNEKEKKNQPSVSNNQPSKRIP